MQLKAKHVKSFSKTKHLACNVVKLKQLINVTKISTHQPTLKPLFRFKYQKKNAIQCWIILCIHSSEALSISVAPTPLIKGVSGVRHVSLSLCQTTCDYIQIIHFFKIIISVNVLNM